jgi:hypothetical protein
MAPRQPTNPAPVQEAPVQEAPGTDLPLAPVRARWNHVQTMFVPGVGLVGYGDELFVSPEQLDSDAFPAIAWDDNWTPDPALHQQATQEG